MKWASLLLVSLIVFLGCVGCGGGLDPKTVTEKFWETMKAGDKEAAKPYLTKASWEKINQNKETKTFDPEKQTVTIGEATLQSDQTKASVATTLTMKQDTQEIQFQFNTVLIPEEGAWKVDFDLTSASMRSEMMKNFPELMKGGVPKATVDPKTGKRIIQFNGKTMTPEELEKFQKELEANKEKVEADLQSKQAAIDEMKRKMEALKKKHEKEKEEKK